MPRIIDTKAKTWTYGVEHELADWDTRLGWDGYGRDPEPNIINSNGVAGDPTLKDYPYGAEINTPPTDRPGDQADLLAGFLKRHKRVFVGHRMGMHVHIRISGLRDSLSHLKQIQRYITDNQGVYPLIDPVPKARREDYDSEAAYKGAGRWVSLIRKSHWTAIPGYRVDRQMRCSTLGEFLAAEVPTGHATGKPLYHAQPRASVNLRQLLQTDTIEFRPFFQTLDPSTVVTAVEWCRDYLLSCFDNYLAVELYKSEYADKTFPPRPEYVHWREVRWVATSLSKNRRDVAARNRRLVLTGAFDDVSNENFEHLGHAPSPSLFC